MDPGRQRQQATSTAAIHVLVHTVHGGTSVTLLLLFVSCACSMQCVPLYDTLGENAIDFILNNA